MLHTPLPELWSIFVKVAGMSPTNEQGFSLTMMGTYLERSENSGEWTNVEFWTTMSYFLSRLNSNFRSRKKLRDVQNRNKTRGR